jgi:hypothetical protein
LFEIFRELTQEKHSVLKNCIMRKIILIITALFYSGITLAQTLSSQVISSSGNNNSSLCWTAGQISINTLQSNNTILTQGFQQSDYKIVSTVNFTETETAISFYPNPANTVLNIYSTSPQEKNIELYDSSGKLVYTGKFEDNIQINVSNLKANLYLLKIDLETFKVIKQ